MNIDRRMVQPMMIGMLLGIALGIALDNLALWLSIGFALGVFYWMVRYQQA
jgi:hypothetical protein